MKDNDSKLLSEAYTQINEMKSEVLKLIGMLNYKQIKHVNKWVKNYDNYPNRSAIDILLNFYEPKIRELGFWSGDRPTDHDNELEWIHERLNKLNWAGYMNER